MRVLALLATFLFAPLARATLIYLDSNLVTIHDEVTRAGAKYRLSNTNFDQSLDNGAGTANSKNFNRLNLGTVSQLSGSTYDFQLSHRSGQGFLWSMTNVANGLTSVLGWGTFPIPITGGILDIDPLLNRIAPNRPFNGVAIEARGIGAGGRMVVSNLTFSSPFAVADGTLANIDVSQGSLTRRILASGDLSKTNWTLSGRVRAFKNTPGGDENVKLTLFVKQYDATFAQPVPEPWTFATVGAALAILLWRRKRSRAPA